MKSAVFFTLAMGAATMHIPWLSQNDNNRQTPIMVMTEEDAVYARDEPCTENHADAEPILE
jgi:hypothetical protein